MWTSGINEIHDVPAFEEPMLLRNGTLWSFLLSNVEFILKAHQTSRDRMDFFPQKNICKADFLNVLTFIGILLHLLARYCRQWNITKPKRLHFIPFPFNLFPIWISFLSSQ